MRRILKREYELQNTTYISKLWSTNNMSNKLSNEQLSDRKGPSKKSATMNPVDDPTVTQPNLHYAATVNSAG